VPAGRARAEPTGESLDLLVVGHTNLDHFLRVEQRPARDRTVPLSRQATELGGTAANIARAAAGYGVVTGLLSRVGDDFPEAFEARLLSEGVDLRGLERVPGTRSPACYIVEDGRGGQMTLIHQGPMGAASQAIVPEELIASSDWIHLTTGDPEFLLRVLETARRRGRRVAVDPAQELHYLWDGKRLTRLLRGAEVLFGNTSEVERVLSLLHLRNRDDLLAFVPLIIETRGARGAMARSRRGTVSVPGQHPRTLRQITGAGDAFRGGFYAGWFSGQPLEHCLRAGTRAATRWIETGGVVRRPGARRATKGTRR
jgi:nucleoside kinase